MATRSSIQSGRGILPLLALDRSSTKPLHRQVYDGYRARILAQDLHPGQSVPSTRELARALQVSRITVLNAYAQLLAEGYFEARVGAGTFISTSLPDRLPFRPETAANEARPGPRRFAALAATIPLHQPAPWVTGRGAFNVGQPALDAFPFRVWSDLMSNYARSLQVSALQYGESMGLLELREAIATYLRTARAVHCEAEQVMIVSGSQQALDIATRALLDPGVPVWVEEPGYWVIHDVLKGAGCRAVPVAVDAEGLDVSAGIRSCRKARAVFVAPSHQYPLGVTMSASRRLQLLEWAQSAGSWIIEDDYDSEYRYDSMPIASLQGLDRHERVIYIGTFSKVLFPSLRLGYVVIPRDLLQLFKNVRHAMDLCPSHTLQAVLTQFIREGHFSRHLRRMRMLYGERRRALVDALQDEFGSRLTILGAEAGMHLTVEIAGGIDDRAVAMRAVAKKLWLWPLSPAYVGDAPRQGFILGFGNTTVAEIPEAVQRMKRVTRP